MCSLRKIRFYRLFITQYQELTKHSTTQCRFQHVKVNHKVLVDPKLKEGLEEGRYKHKNHPGIMRAKKCSVPERLEETIHILAQKYPEEQLKKAAQKLYNYLWSRHLPETDASVQAKAQRLERELMKKYNKGDVSAADVDKQIEDEALSAELLNKLKKLVYHWQPVKYNVFTSFQYMMGRMPYDYSCLYRVFNEIKLRNKEFMPKTMLDFGSGLATSVWAANAVWEKSLLEHYCVDQSSDMNTIAQLLLQDGDEDKPMCYQQVYFRQFFPQSSKNQYDLVVSAFSLMEMTSQSDRLQMVLSLWKKTDKFMIIIENGTNAGFSAISEARDFILQISSQKGGKLEGHIFAPCPHDLPCPRLAANDGTPCNFSIAFRPFYKNFRHQGHSIKGENLTATFSYLVMKKGKRNTDEQQWSRIVREVHRYARKVPINTCSASGHLEHTVITRKRHGADLYMCARKSNWGDLLPAMNRHSSDGEDDGDDDDDDDDGDGKENRDSNDNK